MTEDGIDQSFLASVDPRVVASIRRRAVVHHHKSGDVVASEDGPRWAGIILSGMARVFLRTRAGRQVTLRHAKAGSSIGIGALLGEASVSAQAVTDCDVLSLDTDQIVRLAAVDAALALPSPARQAFD